VAKGLVSVFPIRSAAETEELVRFAVYMDDGEASVCALASVHGGTVASNDRKLGAVLRRLTLPIPVVGTPELIFRWAERAEAPPGMAKQVIERITARARFSPRRDAVCADWWYETLQG
jgi:hypothetical protein